MAEKAYIRNLRRVTRANPTVADVEAVERELYRGSDRASVVMLGSFVEGFLERLLINTVRDDLNSDDRRQLFEFNGAAGTFSDKIMVAYAFKLIGPMTRADLDLIRLLRNEFAHSLMPISFETPEVQAVCQQFRLLDLPDSLLNHVYLARVTGLDPDLMRDRNHPKTRFFAVNRHGIRTPFRG
jgi:hypothetical protein